MYDIAPLLDLPELLVQSPTGGRGYLLRDTLPLGGISLLAGDPKCGKSTVARHLMRVVASVDSDPAWIGRSVKTGTVLYYALEELLDEVVNVFRQAGCIDEPIYLRAGDLGGVPLVEIMKYDMADTNPKLIVVDPMMDALGVNDINNYAEVNANLKAMVNMIRQTDAHLMFIHHSNKSGIRTASSILGSRAIEGATDCNIIMYERDDGKRVLFSKQRYGIPIPKSAVILDKHDLSVTLAPLTGGYHVS
jgi:RecA-family ATPase